MSIICCKVYSDKIEIASDSISVIGYTQSKGGELDFAKLFKVNDNFIIGVTGYVEEGFLMQVFTKNHFPKEATADELLDFMAEFSSWKKNRTNNEKIENNYIIIYQNKAFVVENYLVEEIKDFWSIGAGRDFGLTALKLGKNVEEAVEVACELSVWCELPVIKYTKINEGV